MQDECDVVERGSCVHEHLRHGPRDHPKNLTIARISDRFRVADHTNDREPRARAVDSPPANAFADRRLARPKTMCNALTDNADERRVWCVAGREIAALQERLAAINRSLPVPTNLVAMLEDEVPPDLATEVSGCIECIANDYLRELIEALEQASRVTAHDLVRDFRERQRRRRRFEGR